MNKVLSSRRELAIYDGRDCLGKITVAANGEARAFGRRGKVLGTFESVEAASAAVAMESKTGRRS